MKPNQRAIKIIFGISALMLIFVFLSTQYLMRDEGEKNYQEDDFYDVVFGDYLIQNENCKIPNLSPFSANAMKLFKRQAYKKCHDRNPLTEIQRDENGDNRLIIIDGEIKNFLSWFMNNMTCCYKRIIRSGEGKDADNSYDISKTCIDFSSDHLLNHYQDEFILVKCFGFSDYFPFQKFEIYRNLHAVIISKDEISENRSEKSPNVLLVGIDGMSRLNLIRAMPETFKFINHMDGWFVLKGYTKVGWNTFPNFNAALAGRNMTSIESDCDPKQIGELEKCRFMWNEFSDAGFVTGYAEDTEHINTYNFFGTGFVEQPTDHYLRPFLIACEKNLHKMTGKLWYKCLGYQHYADYVYQYLVDFARTYQNRPHFFLAWTNSFSHDDLSLPSEYDIRMKYYLEELQSAGAFNSSIVIFYSDHGLRFGDIRQKYTGWLEERLPFLYIWLPESFKKKFPQLAENLKINQERLVSPYDLHITLKHILQLSGDSNQNLTAISCEKCQSLFYEVPHNRTCSDAGIDKEYCACSTVTSIYKSSSKVKRAADFAVASLNEDLKKFENCAQLELFKISSARESQYGNAIDYLITFSVLPSHADMEATVRCADVECYTNPKLIGKISRINKYNDESKCIFDFNLREYCYCI